MSAQLQLLFGAGLVWLGVFLAASVVAATLYGGFRRLARLASPASRSGATLLYGLLPALVATLVVCMLNFATLYSWVLPQHCHDMVCAPHAPEFAAPAAQAAVGTAAVLLGLAALLWLAATHLRRQRRQSRVTRHLARPERGFHVVDSATPAAWCDGLWFPAVYLTRGLLDEVSDEELRILLAHESAHVRRRDNLARLVLDWVAAAWPATAKRALREDFAVAAEQACDAEAALYAGNGSSVSALIQRFHHDAGAHHDSRAGIRVADRVGALLDTGNGNGSAALAPWAALLLLWLGGAFLFTLAAHPLLEWLSV